MSGTNSKNKSLATYFATLADPFGPRDVVVKLCAFMELPPDTRVEQIAVRLFPDEGRLIAGVRNPAHASVPGSSEFLMLRQIFFPASDIDTDRIETSFDQGGLFVSFPCNDNKIAQQKLQSSIGDDEYGLLKEWQPE